MTSTEHRVAPEVFVIHDQKRYRAVCTCPFWAPLHGNVAGAVKDCHTHARRSGALYHVAGMPSLDARRR